MHQIRSKSCISTLVLPICFHAAAAGHRLRARGVHPRPGLFAPQEFGTTPAHLCHFRHVAAQAAHRLYSREKIGVKCRTAGSSIMKCKAPDNEHCRILEQFDVNRTVELQASVPKPPDVEAIRDKEAALQRILSIVIVFCW